MQKKTNELGAEDNSVDVIEATTKCIKLAGNNKAFEGMRCNVNNKALFGTFVNICLVHFCSSINLHYNVYNTVI